MRRHSLTSSQTHAAFDKAFSFYKDNASWVAVAEYLHGNNYKRVYKINDEDEADNGDSESGAEDEQQEEPMLSLEDFVTQYVHSEDDDQAGVAAFNFIRPYVANDNVEPTQGAADETLNQLSKPTTHAAIKILSERVPDAKRKKIPTTIKTVQKELSKWLMFTNSHREFMFFSKNALADLVAEKRIKINGSKTIDKMIEALGSHIPGQNELSAAEEQALLVRNLPPKEAAIRVMMQKSFLPHQKGQERENCVTGHLLEIPVLESWITETSSRDYPIRNLKINGAYTVGLVEKKGSPWAKDSIDFVLTVCDRILEDHQAWGVEIKSRVSPTTAGREEDFLSEACRNKHEYIEAEKVHKMVENVKERFQILHHSFVYDFNKVILIVGDSQAEILQSTLVNFDEDLREHYGKVLVDLKDMGLSWAYNSDGSEVELPIKLPEKIIEIGRTLPSIKDDDALHGSANLWLSFMAMKLPTPSLIRIIPAVCAYWNAVKSGSDTTTKLMDDRNMYPPHVNCETIASTRLISIAFVLIHRISQSITSKADLDNNYGSLARYRNAASHRFTFHETIITSRNALIKSLCKDDQQPPPNENDINLSNTAAPTTPPARSLRSARNAHGVIPQKMTFGIKLPFVTPAKIAQKVKKGTVSDSVRNMYETCTGRLVQVVDNKKRQRCCKCSKLTSYYCAGCKSWYCFAVRLTKNTNEQDTPNMLYCNLKGKREEFFISCFTEKHQDAWETEDTKTSAVITP